MVLTTDEEFIQVSVSLQKEKLFFDGAMSQWTIHVSTLVAAIRLKAECCIMHGRTIQQTMQICGFWILTLIKSISK